MSNTFTKFIDSCVGAIARKVQDEFDESKHPRDKGGKFTRGSGSRSWSGGGDYKAGPEGKKVSKISNEKADKLNEYATRLEKAGHDPKDIHAMNVQGDLKGMKKALRQYEGEGASALEETDFEKEAKSELSEYAGMDREEMEQLRSEIIRKQEREPYGSDKVHEYQKQISELTKLINRIKQSSKASVPESDLEGDDGYMGLSKEELAEEEEYENARERARREKDDDRVTGPEDRDYMNEEDDDDSDPVAKMRKHLDDDLFELATRSESEEEFISKAERKIKQELWAVKSAPEELPVQGQKAEYVLKKILSEIKSGTSEYW